MLELWSIALPQHLHAAPLPCRITKHGMHKYVHNVHTRHPLTSPEHCLTPFVNVKGTHTTSSMLLLGYFALPQHLHAAQLPCRITKHGMHKNEHNFHILPQLTPLNSASHHFLLSQGTPTHPKPGVTVVLCSAIASTCCITSWQN